MARGDPPDPEWDNNASEFNTAQNYANNYGQDANGTAILDASSTANYLYAAQSSGLNAIAWFIRTQANANSCPKALIPTATFNVIKSGTLDKTTMKIAYGGNNYRIVFKVDANGDQIAYAQQVA